MTARTRRRKSIQSVLSIIISFVLLTLALLLAQLYGRLFQMTDKKDDKKQSTVFVLEPPIQQSEEKPPEDSGSEVHGDRILALKMHHLNNAINEIGFTTYQLKLFFLNGFGNAVDSLLILLNALTQPQVILQYQSYVSKAQMMAVGLGLLFGAFFGV